MKAASPSAGSTNQAHSMSDLLCQMEGATGYPVASTPPYNDKDFLQVPPSEISQNSTAESSWQFGSFDDLSFYSNNTNTEVQNGSGSDTDDGPSLPPRHLYTNLHECNAEPQSR